MTRIITLILIFLAGLFIPEALSSQPNMGKRNNTKLSYRGFMMDGIRLEAGFSVGAANAMTDIAASEAKTQAAITDVYSRGMSPAVSAFARYRFNHTLALRASASAMMVRGNDKWSSDIQVVNRGKSFSNNILEMSLVGELYMPRRFHSPKQDFRLNVMDLYVFGGFSVFHHSPKLQGPVIDDYDYRIVNTPDIYDNWQLGVPMGAGIKWTFSRRWSLGLDFNFRYTFFDYLDGFRRPYSNRNDFFFTSNINVGFVIDSHQYESNRGLYRYLFSSK